jgi:hypothetical protein
VLFAKKLAHPLLCGQFLPRVTATGRHVPHLTVSGGAGIARRGSGGLHHGAFFGAWCGRTRRRVADELLFRASKIWRPVSVGHPEPFAMRMRPIPQSTRQPEGSNRQVTCRGAIFLACVVHRMGLLSISFTPTAATARAPQPTTLRTPRSEWRHRHTIRRRLDAHDGFVVTNRARHGKRPYAKPAHVAKRHALDWSVKASCWRRLGGRDSSQ